MVEINPESRIYVAGHNGFGRLGGDAGIAVPGPYATHLSNRQELDLTDQARSAGFSTAVRPDAVIMAAAQVGGIQANNSRPAEFIGANLLMQSNVIESAYRAGVKKFVFLGRAAYIPSWRRSRSRRSTC